MISMGTEVSEQDMLNIKALCEQVIGLSEYRAQLYDYLKARMAAIAPNLTVLVGELVGARLIAHAGSLMSLAKQPGSTVQILGAEKVRFCFLALWCFKRSGVKDRVLFWCTGVLFNIRTSELKKTTPRMPAGNRKRGMLHMPPAENHLFFTHYPFPPRGFYGAK